MIYRFIDLFAGIKISFIKLGFDCVYSSDIDQNCKKHNFKDKLDISGIESIKTNCLDDYELLVGGFLIPGYPKGFSDKGCGDFFDIYRLLKARPVKAFFLENVKNLISHNNGNTIKVMLDFLKELGYYV